MKTVFYILVFLLGISINCKNSPPCNQIDSSCNLISSLILENRIRASRNIISFSPPGGTYKFDQFVTITSGPASSIIRYTIDGSEPSCARGAIYTTPVRLIGIKTFSLRAVACNDSVLASSRNDSYTITVSQLRADSNLRFWYSADSLGLENGSEVKVWSDLSGNENHLYSSSNSLSNPTFLTNVQNGKPAIRLTSTQRHFMNTKTMNGYTATREGTGFLVFRKYSSQAEEVYFSIGTLGSIVNARNWRANTLSPSICSSLSPNPINCGSSATTSVPDSGYHVIAFSIDSTSNVTYYYDGVVNGSGLPGTPFTFSTANIVHVGAGMNADIFLDAEILELLFFEKSFESSFIPTIHCLLQNKYKLTVGGNTCL